MALAERPDLAEHLDMALARRLALNPDSRQDLLIALSLHVENGWPQPVRANGSNQSTGGMRALLKLMQTRAWHATHGGTTSNG